MYPRKPKISIFVQKSILLGFWTQKLFLGLFWPQNLNFCHFRRYPNYQSLLWLTYTCGMAPNGLKLSGIAKFKKSESFIKLASTVWEIRPKKWQEWCWEPTPQKIGGPSQKIHVRKWRHLKPPNSNILNVIC